MSLGSPVLAGLAAGLVALALGLVEPARAAEPLRVCLDENVPPLSWKRGEKSGGLDHAVAEAVARRLGRELQVQWFESELDDESNPAGEANALLSDGRCHLVGGYPLFADALGEPRAERSRLPDHEGAKRGDRRRQVPLEAVAASRAYRFAPLAVVLGPGMAGRAIGSLADLEGARLGVEEGTLADAILMTYGGRRFIEHITHVPPDEDLLGGLERGEYDATLVEVHRLDAHRARRPESGLTSSGHYHSIGFNIGFLGLARETGLLDEVNAALGDMLAKGELESLARAAGATYLPPRSPEVRTGISRSELGGD